MRDCFQANLRRTSHKQNIRHRSVRWYPVILAVWLLLVPVVTPVTGSVAASGTIGQTVDGDTSEHNSIAVVLRGGSEIVLLSSYRESMKIGEKRTLIASATGGAAIRWKSSSSRIASVDPYGVVTAKKAGTCQITAKSSASEASCTVTVEKTTVTLNTKAVSIENGSTFLMEATTSNGSPVSWKSSRQSVALISEDGLVQAIKPGTTVITATADGVRETCMLTVLKPTIRLSSDSIKMYRNQCAQLEAAVSSGRPVTWTSGKPSVAVVDENGRITAIKHGEARISAKVDGVTRYCTVTVQPPKIRLDRTSLVLKTGQTYTLQASVSSGATPTFTCSSKKTAAVSSSGVIRAKAKGSCTITVSEDGAIARCKVKVTT